MPQPFTTRPEIRGTFGAVASTHWLASTVGMGILERGGNAFDAAVATGFTLQIVEPHLNGPGGEVPIIFMRADEDTPQVLCGQGTAPAAANIECFRRQGHRLIPGTGLLPAVVPGAFDAWMLLLRDHGSMKLRDVMQAAIDYAARGFPVAHRVAESIHATRNYFLAHWPTSAEVWVPGGRAPMPGERFCTPQIASCYERILSEAESAGGDRVQQIEAARQAFYQGFVAQAIDSFFTTALMDSSGSENAGLLTGDDLSRWQASYEPTTSIDYHGITVHKTGPWGQGPVLLQALRLLRNVDISAMDPVGDEYIHQVAETMKLCLADRDACYGDPQFTNVPLDHLLSDAYLSERHALIGSNAQTEFLPGLEAIKDGRAQTLLSLSDCEGVAQQHSGEPGYAELQSIDDVAAFTDTPEVEGDTVHLDIVDQWGNMVSATPSGGWLQGSPAVASLGFNISTRGQMFWLDASLPSALRPRSRPRTTLTPTLISIEGKPILGIGSPGGDQQDQWTLAVLLHHLHHRQNLQEAIDAPLFHTSHYIKSFYPREFDALGLLVEGRLPELTINRLRERGHNVKVQDDWSIGRLITSNFIETSFRTNK